MSKRTLSEHWKELRYHMIAGFFWYLVSLMSLTGITKTFTFLQSHIGMVSTVGVDIVVIIVAYVAAIYLIRAWAGIKAVKQLPEEFHKVQIYREDCETATYKWKVRIAIKNETDRLLHIRNLFWIANGGEISLEIPPKMKMQIEKVKDGFRTNQWVTDEFYELPVPPGFTFQTWIGLHQQLTDRDFGRVREAEKFATLSLTIDGYDSDLLIPI